MRQAPLIVIAMALGLAGCETTPSAHPLPDVCFEKPETGNGRAAIQRFYYDSDEQSCKAFLWGGSQGKVPFETLDACIATCYAPAPQPLPRSMAPAENPPRTPATDNAEP